MKIPVESKRTLNVIIIQDIIIACIALVEEIPGIIAFGNTVEEAKKNMYFELNNYELTNGSLNIETIQFRMLPLYSLN